jgi:Mg2+-importing ATPase
MLWVFHAGPSEFRSGWFVESLATQALVIFAIRTRRVPFFRSRPSLEITLSAIGVVAIGALLPATPLARTLGFAPLPGPFFGALVGMVCGYLVLIEIGKRWFYRNAQQPAQGAPLFPTEKPDRSFQRRARRFVRTPHGPHGDHTAVRPVKASTT